MWFAQLKNISLLKCHLIKDFLWLFVSIKTEIPTFKLLVTKPSVNIFKFFILAANILLFIAFILMVHLYSPLPLKLVRQLWMSKSNV